MSNLIFCLITIKNFIVIKQNIRYFLCYLFGLVSLFNSKLTFMVYLMSKAILVEKQQ